MQRREFIERAAMAAAVAAASAPASAEDTDPLDPSVRERVGADVRWDKAPCRFCGTGCTVQVGVKDGRVVAVSGDRLAPVNKGLLCMKGYHVGLALYGEDRLTQPLVRRGETHVPISWDAALDLLADRIMANPAGFALYGSGQWTIPEGYAAQKFMKGGLSNNHIDPNARLCMASAVTGYVSTFGVDEPYNGFDDLDAADVVLLWGNNPAEMHPVLFSRWLARRTRGESVELVDIGTRRTRTTSFANRYIAMKPHGDLAIANGLMRLLIENGTYDRDFVARFAAFRKPKSEPDLHGEPATFDEFRRHLEAYTPERVAELSGVSPADMRYLADLFGDRRKKILSLWCMGMNQHTRGTAINRLVHGLHLLSGHFGRPGDGPQSLTGQPSACGTVREVGTLSHALPGGLVVANEAHRHEAEEIWHLPAGRISARPGYHTVEMWRRFSTPASAGGDLHTLWVQVTNPAQSLPNTKLLFDPSRRHPSKFLVVSDVYPTATVRAADLILPSAMWVEKNGMVGNSERRTQQWFRMVAPPGQARDDAWQTIALARKLFDRGHPGMRDADGRFLFHVTDDAGAEVPVWDYAHYYDVNVDRALFEEYRAFSRLERKDLAPYEEYVRARGLRWPVTEQDGVWRETRYRFVEHEDPYVEAGKGLQFYRSASNDDRARIWIEDYVAPPEVPDDQFPFWLCTGRVIEHWHTGTMTMRIAPLRRAMPEAYVEMHRDDAFALGIEEGNTVTVETRRGSLDLPVWIDGRGLVERGSLFVPFFDERALVNELTLEAFCPISKQPDYKKCAARIRAASVPGRPT